jgi:GT2 family glycosyltransferase
MESPRLGDLPAPPPGRTGWPWTEQSAPLPPTMADGAPWPRITIVTPSYNQAKYVEATLRSILLQSYPNLEYIVMDGGSRDGSVEIIKRYAPWLTHWVSERDGGQSAAVNKGLRLGTGMFATWTNSDDMLERNALTNHSSRAGFQPGTVYVGDCTYINEHDVPQFVHRGRVHSLEDLLRARTVWRTDDARGHIVQPEVLFPLELTLKVGGLNPSNHRTMDYELWGRLFLAGAVFVYTHIRFARFRLHSEQKTEQMFETAQSLVATARRLLDEIPTLSPSTRQEIERELEAHEQRCWRETGQLARFGLPPWMVTTLRGMHSRIRRFIAGGAFRRE